MKKAIIIIIFLGIVFLVIFSFANQGESNKALDTNTNTATPINENNTNQENKRMTIQIPLIEPGGSLEYGDRVAWDKELMDQARQKGEYVGCGDKIYYMQKEIAYTQAPLQAIYKEIFALESPILIQNKEYMNPVYVQTQERTIEGMTYQPLAFERVEIQNNTAQVYLTGDYITIGSCEPPTTQAVLTFAALQYPNVQDVVIYINNQPAYFVHN